MRRLLAGILHAALPLALAAVPVPSVADDGSTHEGTSRMCQVLTPAGARGGYDLDLIGTAIQPAARGRVDLDIRRDEIRLRVAARDLSPPSIFGNEYLTWVLWNVGPDGAMERVVEIPPAKGTATARASLGHGPLGFVVTAEPYAAVSAPSDTIVLRAVPRGRAVKHLRSSEAPCEFLARGAYLLGRTQEDLALLFSTDLKSPPAVAQARNAIEIVRRSGGDRYAAERLREATRRLLKAKELLGRGDRDEAVAEASAAIETAESARRIAAARRTEEARIENELAAAREEAARLKLALEQARAESAEQARMREEVERRLESETARIASEKFALERQALRAAEEAAMARAGSEAARAAADAERRGTARRETDEATRALREQLFEAGLEAERGRLEAEKARADARARASAAPVSSAWEFGAPVTVVPAPPASTPPPPPATAKPSETPAPKPSESATAPAAPTTARAAAPTAVPPSAPPAPTPKPGEPAKPAETTMTQAPPPSAPPAPTPKPGEPAKPAETTMTQAPPSAPPAPTPKPGEPAKPAETTMTPTMVPAAKPSETAAVAPMQSEAPRDAAPAAEVPTTPTAPPPAPKAAPPSTALVQAPLTAGAPALPAAETDAAKEPAKKQGWWPSGRKDRASEESVRDVPARESDTRAAAAKEEEGAPAKRRWWWPFGKRSTDAQPQSQTAAAPASAPPTAAAQPVPVPGPIVIQTPAGTSQRDAATREAAAWDAAARERRIAALEDELERQRRQMQADRIAAERHRLEAERVRAAREREDGPAALTAADRERIDRIAADQAAIAERQEQLLGLAQQLASEQNEAEQTRLEADYRTKRAALEAEREAFEMQRADWEAKREADRKSAEAAEARRREEREQRRENLREKLAAALEAVESEDALVARLTGGFASGSATLEQESRLRLARVAGALLSVPGALVEIEGHTDDTGSEAANRALSEARARAARKFLVEQGLPPDSVVARGYGETQPVADNATVAGRKANRRVDIVVRGEAIGLPPEPADDKTADSARR